MLEILSMNPPLPSHREYVMLESFTCTMVVKYENSLKELRPQIWTNVMHKKNPSGKWHAIDLRLLKTESDGMTHHFRSTCILTGQGSYEFTARVGVKFLEDEDVANDGGKCEEHELPETAEKEEEDEPEVDFWKWASGFGSNGRLVVHPPNDKMPWTKGPQAVEVFPQIFVGNFIAASYAVDLGFQAVLNMSSELDDYYPPESKIQYKKLALPDGAQNPIPENIIKEAVDWIHERVINKEKVLIHCRAGIGRSGSIGIAYMYYCNPSWTFRDTLKAIWKEKPEVYPHKELDITLPKIYPRVEPAQADQVATDGSLS